MGKKACFVSTTSITMKCFIVPIAHELAKAGIDVTLICSNDESMYPLCEANGVKYHPIHMGRGIDASGLKAIKELKAFLKEEKFDLVQYCTPNAACYTSIAAKLARIPTRLYCQWGIRYVGLSGIPVTYFAVKFLTMVNISNKPIFTWMRKMSTLIFMSQRIFLTVLPASFFLIRKLYEDQFAAFITACGGTIVLSAFIIELSKYNTRLRNLY